MTAWRKIRAATVTGLLAFVALFGAGNAFAQSLSVAPAELEQEINYNNDAADQKLTLTNPTAASISYTLGIVYGPGATGWLKNPGGGVVAKDNGTKEITVKYQNTKAIDAGVYTATITITETSGGGGSTAVVVTLTVVHPIISPEADINKSCNVRKLPEDETVFRITNVGNGLLSFSTKITYDHDNDPLYRQGSDKSSVDWLSVDPASGSNIGTTGDKTFVDVTVTVNSTNLPDSHALPNGCYEADIELTNTSTNLPDDTVTIHVTLTVNGGWIAPDAALPNNLGVLYCSVGENPVNCNGEAVNVTYFAINNLDDAGIVAIAPVRASNHGSITCSISTSASWLTVPSAAAELPYDDGTSIFVTAAVNTTALTAGDYTGVINLKDAWSANNKYTTVTGPPAWYVKDNVARAEKETPRSAGTDLNVFLHVGNPSISLLVDTEEDNDEYVYQDKSCLVNGRYGYDPQGNKIDDSIEIFAAWAGDATKYTSPLAGNPTDDTADSEYQGPTSFEVINEGDGPLKYHIATTYHQPAHAGWIANAADLATVKTLLFRLDTFGDNTTPPLQPETFNYKDIIDLNIDSVTSRLPAGTYTATLSVVSDNVNPCPTKSILVVLRVGPKVYIPDTLEMTINGVSFTDTNGVERDTEGPCINLQAPVGGSPDPSRFFVMLPGKTSPGIDPLTGAAWDKYPTFCPDMTGAIAQVDPSYGSDSNANQLSFSVQRGGYGTGSWMSFDIDEGTLLKPNDATCVKVTYDTTGMAEGTYTGYIFVNGRDLLGNDAANTSFTYSDPATPTITPDPLRDGNYIKVNLELVRPTILADPASITRTVTQGDSATATFNISNRYQNGTTLFYSLSTDYLTSQTGWLSVDPASGSSTGPADSTTINVSYNTSGLKAGTYSANVVISSANASNAPLNVRVDIIVLGPAIGLEPTVLNPTCATGTNPATSNSFQLWNAGPVGAPALNYSIASTSSGWLTCSGSGSITVAQGKQPIAVTYDADSLLPGTYTGTITVTNTDDGSTKTIAVTLTVIGPQIAVNKTTFDLTQSYGGPVPAGQTFNLWNATNIANSTLNFAITSDRAWLTVAPSSGASTGPADVQPIALTFNTASLPVGNYTANLKISDPMASNSPITIPVNLQVRGSVINLSASDLNFRAPIGGTVTYDANTFTITNAGVTALNYTLSKDQAWLGLAPTSGTIAAGDNAPVAVTVDPTNLLAGSYTATVTATAADGSSSKTLAVYLTVTAPAIAADQTALSESLNFGAGSVTPIFHVWNSDATSTVMSYSVSGDANWITVSDATASGTSTGPTDQKSVSVTLSATGLTPGAYSGHLTITCGKASNNPLVIPVALTVNGSNIGLDKSSLNPACGIGTSPTGENSFRIVNGSSTAALNYRLSADVPWITEFTDPNAGVVPINATSGVITVTYDTSNVAAGSYPATITVRSTGDGATAALPVILTVHQPGLATGAASVAASLPFGDGNPIMKTLAVWNSDASTLTSLNYVSSENAAWVALTDGTDSGVSTGPSDVKQINLTFSSTGLAPGSYSAILTITAPNAAASPKLVTVSLTIEGSKLALSTNAFTPKCALGQNTASSGSDSFTVTNNGAGTIDFTVTANVPWITNFSISEYTLDPNDTSPAILVYYDSSNMAVGSHAGVISVVANDGTTETIPATLTVYQSGLAASVASLSQVRDSNAAPATQTFDVWNTDASTLTTLDYTVSSNAAWLTISSGATGSSGGPADLQTVTLAFDTAALSPGSYSAVLTVTGDKAANSPLSIPVSLTVAGSKMVLSANAFNPQCAIGQNTAADDSFTVTNTGGASLSFTVSTNVPWIESVEPSFGTLNPGDPSGDLQVTYNTAAVAAGAHSGTILVVSSDGTTETIPVTLTVHAPSVAVSMTALVQTTIFGVTPASQTVQVWNGDNSAQTTLRYILASNAPWLAVSSDNPGQTSTGPADRDILTFSYVAAEVAKLAPGSYDASVTVVDANASNSPVTIAVNLTVQSIQMMVSKSALSPTSLFGASAPSDSFLIGNRSSLALDYTVSDNVSWLSCSPDVGRIAPGAADVTVAVTYSTLGLAAGTHSGVITVGNADGTSSTITVTLTVYAAGIAVEQSVLTPSCSAGHSPASQAVALWNSDVNGTTLNYALSSDVSWLTLSGTTTGSSTGPGDRKTFTVNYATTSLAVGSYTGHVYVTDGFATNSPYTITVNLAVTDAALVVSPTTINASCLVGGVPGGQSFAVTNGGQTAFVYSLSTNVAWITLPANGDLNPGETDTLGLSFATATLAAGTYTGVVTVGVDSLTSKTVTVTLNVNAAAIAVSQSNFTPSCAVGNDPVPSTQTVLLWNADANGTTLDYTTSSDVAWLTLSGATTGTSTGSGDRKSLILNYSTSTLAVGSYNGHVYIADGAATNSPHVITVSLTVTDTAIVLSPSDVTTSCVAGGLPAAVPFKVTNAGQAAFTYSPSSNVTWLTAPIGATLAPGETDSLSMAFATSSLAAGDYTGVLTVSALGGTAKTLTVHLTVYGPAIVADQAALAPSCLFGQAPANQALTLWNSDTHGTTLNYTVTSNATWLVVGAGATGSSTGPAVRRPVTLSYDTASLYPGTYVAALVVAGTGATNSPLSIPVTLTVQGADFSLTPAALAPECGVGTNPAGANGFRIVNAAAVGLDYTLSADVAWVTSLTDPSGGTVAAKSTSQEITVVYDTTALAAGAYTGNVTVVSTADGTTVKLPLHLTVRQPGIAASVSSLVASLSFGSAAAAKTITVWNSDVTGLAPLSYTATTAATWLSVTGGTSGVSTGPADPKQVELTFDPAGLAPGSYSSTLTITGAKALNSPLVLPVTLVVNGSSFGFDRSSLDPVCAIGGAPAGENQFCIVNNLSSELTYRLSADVPWITGWTDPNAGVVPGNSKSLPVALTYDASTLAAGVHAGNITVQSAVDGTTAVLPVTLTVFRPGIATGADTVAAYLDFTSGLAQKELTIWNADGSTLTELSYSASASAPWLSLQADTGVSDGPGDVQRIQLVFHTDGQLAPGTYSTTMTIVGDNAANSPKLITVSLTVGGAKMVLSTNAFSPKCALGQNTSAANSFTITNNGTSDLSYTVAIDVPWITAVTDPNDGGPIAPGATSLALTAVYDTSNVSVGTQTGTISVVSSDSTTQTIQVTLTVYRPGLAASVASLSQLCDYGVPPQPQTFDVWNTDASTLTTLDYTVSSNAAWLTISSGASGSSGGPADLQTVTLAYDTATLSPGSYSAVLTLTGDKAANSPLSIPVSLTVAGSKMVLSANAFNPQCAVGQNTAANDSFTVTNTGGASLSFTVSTNVPWIESVVPSSGTLIPGATSGDLQVTYNTAAVAAGTHSGTILVVSADGTTETIPVTLTVHAPTVVVSMLALTQTTTYKATPASQTVQVWNGDSSAQTTLRYILASNAPWLAVSSDDPGQTSTGPADRDILTFSYVAAEVATLAPGNYDAAVSVIDANAANSPVTITVRLTVLGTKMVVSKTALTPVCQAGRDASPDSFVIGNRGSVSLTYTVTDNVPWLSCLPISGTIVSGGADVPVAVTYTTSGLAAGTHAGAITVTSADGTSVIINVTLTVQTPAIATDQSLLNPACVLGHDPVPDTERLAIWNSDASGTALAYTTSVDQTWLTLSGDTAATSTGPGDKKTLVVTYDTTGLAAGLHQAHIYITCGGASNSPVAIPVNLTVSTTTLVVSPSAIFNQCAFKANPVPNSDSFTITNASAVDIRYNLSSSVSWIDLHSPGTDVLLEAGATTDPVAFSYVTTELAAGTYAGVITVSTTDGVTVNLPVQLIVRQASIATSLAALAPNCVVGSQPSPRTQTFEIWNADASGLTDLNYSLFANQSWLSITSPASGVGSSTGPGDRGKVTVTYDTAKLGVGTYTATILAVAGYSSNSPISITVTLTVKNAELTLIPPSLEAQCAYGSNPAANGSFKILNQGSASINFNLLTEFNTGVPQWFSVSAPADSPIREGTATADLAVTYDTIGLDAGTYTDNIVVLTTAGSRYELPVRVTVYKPAIATSVAALNQTGVYGTIPGDLSFKIWNSGNIITTLKYAIVPNQDWLEVEDSDPSHQSTGPTDQNTITVKFTEAARALSVGTHVATLNIAGVNASNTPQTVTVTLQVQDPTMQVTSPLGGEQWALGSTQTISWASNAGGLAKIELYKGGVFNIQIADNLDNATSSSYTWLVPTTLDIDDDYTIKVTAKTTGTSATSAAFAIVLGDYLLLSAPNGGETISNNAGSSYTITWLSNMGGTVRIELLKGGVFNRLIDAAAPNTDSYAWNTTGWEAGVDYRVKLTCGALTSTSAADFIIKAVEYITVTAPDGGERWAFNSTHDITWDTNVAGNVKIELLKSGVSSVIATVPANDKTYSWTIAAATGADYKVKVSSVATPTVFGSSAAVFSVIDPYFTLTAPADGAIWKSGSIQNITWDSSGVAGDVKIELLKGGKLDSVIASSTPVEAQLYAWDIPDTQASGNDYKVKITSVDNPLISVASGNFSIVGGYPVIAVNPASFAVTLVKGQTAVKQLAISNAGDWPLTWSIDDGYVAMNSTDQPDSVGYGWVDISESGAPITGLGDDTNVGPFDIGFAFPFYGQSFSSFRVCSNGWISFSSEDADAMNQPLPSAVAPANLVALFWDDLNFSASGAAYYQVVDGNLVVEFKAVPRSADGGLVTCELILKPSGEILMQYQTVPATVDACTVGVQNADGTKGVQVCYNQAFLTDILAVSLTPYWPAPSAASGTVNPGETANVDLAFSAVGLEVGLHQTAIEIASNSPDTPLLEIPVALTVTVAEAVLNDFNGDGMSDLVFRSSSSGAMFIDLMNGKQIDDSGFLYRSGGDWEMAGTGDLDKNGRADIILKNTANGAHYVFLMNGLAPTDKGFLCQSADTQWNVCAVADINGDGDQDIVLRHSGTGAVYAWLMAGAEIAAQGFLYEGGDSAWDVVGLADLNGDGTKDLVLRNPATGALYAYLLKGLSSLDQGYIWRGGDAAWKAVGFGKFNDDQKEDILLRNDSTADGYVYLMDGIQPVGGDFAWRAKGQTSWTFAALADFNGDGKADILLRHAATGALYLYLMDGARVTAQGYAWIGGDPSWTLAQCADFNGDGKADILLGHAADGKGYVYLMDGLSVIDGGMVWKDAPDWKLR